ncbi:hypothetical protein FACS1894190_07000 [Spirochaetia bacterium]|nr:hypothetical protein FACS1894190_07000 [Spirochaetia bacterium]GHV23396.1 hypothetical protein FACS189494_11360 [Spirochaetia bacterium]
MKKMVSFAVIILISAVVVFAADPLEGYWLSIDDKTDKVTASWHIYQDGGNLLGALMGAPGVKAGTLATRCTKQYSGYPIVGKVSEMKLLGTPFIYGLQKKSEGNWYGGKIIDPNDGNVYPCDLIFHASDGKKYREDRLELKVFFIRQFWKKTTLAEAEKAF